jgi:hypothetical protein
VMPIWLRWRKLSFLPALYADAHNTRTHAGNKVV